MVAVLSCNVTSAFAESKGDDLITIEQISYELFGEVKIKSSENLYNLDESPDYIYADFENSGYAVFLAETLELLEYSPQGSLPFLNSKVKKYYSGPQNYFNKEGERFINAVTNESFILSTADARTISQNIRGAFSVSEHKGKEIDTYKEQNDIEFNSAENVSTSIMSVSNSPPINRNIPINPPANTKYIPNSSYFMDPDSPKHGKNNGYSCAAVSIQLLLSYNNYYNDRRIIDNAHLFTINPNNVTDPMLITNEILGSTQGYHDFIVNNYNIGNGSGSSLSDAEGKLRNILNDRNSQIAGNINFAVNSKTATTLPFGLGNYKTIDSADIIAEINAGRPLALATSDNLNGNLNHIVTAYGYGDYTYPNGEGTYLGYIVHFGWDETGIGDRVNVWTNSSWYCSYLTLKINHEHAYLIDPGIVVNNNSLERRCIECGHRILIDLYNVSGSTITSARFPLTGSVTIPATINGTTITAIGYRGPRAALVRYRLGMFLQCAFR